MTIEEIGAKLSSLSEPIFSNREWPQYEDLGFGEDELEDLLDLASGFYLEIEQSDRDSAISIHAWRALAAMGRVEILPDFLSLSIGCDDIADEWFADEFPTLLGKLGMGALPELLAAVESTPEYPCLAEGLIEGLPLMACDTDGRRQAIETLVGLLGQDDFNRHLRAMVVASLVELKAVEKIEEIRVQFEANGIDISEVGDLEEVELALGLRSERTTSRPDLEKEEARLAQRERNKLAGEFPVEGTLEEKLQYFLFRYGSEQSISRVDELDGYLLSLTLSGVKLSVEEVSAFVWDTVEGTSQSAVMESEDEKTEWLNCLGEFLQGIKDGMNKNDYQPHVSVWPDAAESMDPEAPFFTPWLEGLMAGEEAFAPEEKLSRDEENERNHFSLLVFQVFDSEEQGIRLLEDREENPIYALMEMIQAKFMIRSRGSERSKRRH